MEFDGLLKPIFKEGLQKVADWYRADSDFFLRSIFDLVGFKKRDEHQVPYFATPRALSTRISYPSTDKTALRAERKQILREIEEKYRGFSEIFLQELSTN